MKKHLLNRYERDAEGRIVIDVAAAKTEDLYNNFDKSAPYIRRDLDEDLGEYLIGCARELSQEDFFIRFTLGHFPDEDRRSRIKGSVENFFIYMAERERHRIREMFRTSAVFLGVGMAVMLLSVWVNQSLGADASTMRHVFEQGLTIAAWVAIWEALSTLLVRWLPQRRNVKIYLRLARAGIEFRSAPQAAADIKTT